MTKASVAAAIGVAIRGRRATVISELGATLDELGLTEHDTWRQEPHSGGLGWGLPCALGMKLADPDRLVVATMGDGSYLFANPVAAHHVAEAHGIAVLTVILNNAGYGAVQQSVTGLYPTGYAAKADVVPLTSLSPSPDFRLVAESCRAWAETVTDPTSSPARCNVRSSRSTPAGKPCSTSTSTDNIIWQSSATEGAACRRPFSSPVPAAASAAAQRSRSRRAATR